jgi:superfamily I DNA and RNA helicase
MHSLSKNLIAGAVFGALSVAGAMHASAVSANDDVQHQVVEIKAVKGHDLTVWVQKDGDAKTIVLDANELLDQDAVRAKLAELDEDTRNTVLKTLDEVKTGAGGPGSRSERVFVMNKGDGQRIDISEDEVQIITTEDGGSQRMVKQIFIDDGEQNLRLKGHADAITQLIERGEFSVAELDKIQVALDAKR